jgi:histidine triad (HIT) family protein
VFTIPAHDRCPFCDYLAGIEPCAFVARGPQVSAFLNRTQFERGALLLVPNDHVESVLELKADLVAAIYTEAQRLAKGLVPVLGATGLNIFQNNGVRAGQSVAHYHVHVVPRYETSQPWRRFTESEFEHTPFEELDRLATELRAVFEPAP